MGTKTTKLELIKPLKNQNDNHRYRYKYQQCLYMIKNLCLEYTFFFKSLKLNNKKDKHSKNGQKT